MAIFHVEVIFGWYHVAGIGSAALRQLAFVNSLAQMEER